MDPMESIPNLGKHSSGQSVCSQCLKTYNNRAKPEFCECGKWLGGRYVAKDKKNVDPHIITPTMASVRTNRGGHPTRNFVDLSTNKVGKIKLR